MYGANYKLIYSNFDAASSFGMAIDIAAAYDDTAKMFTATLLIKNIGAELKAFNKNDRDRIPFEIQAGFSKRLKYVPFRISVVIHNIQKFDIRYPDLVVGIPGHTVFQKSHFCCNIICCPFSYQAICFLLLYRQADSCSCSEIFPDKAVRATYFPFPGNGFSSSLYCSPAGSGPGIFRGMGHTASSQVRIVGGAKGQSRTGDTCIFSAVLYHLSYLVTNLRSRTY